MEKRMKLIRITTLVVLTVLLIMLCIAPVSAHKAFVGAFLTGNTGDEIQIKAWYEGGMPMANAETTIYTVIDGEKEVYVEGVTDDQGFFSFEPGARWHGFENAAVFWAEYTRRLQETREALDAQWDALTPE